MQTMGTLQRLPRLDHVAQKIGRRRQQLQILTRQGTRLVGKPQ
jgi:hypothetical protein